MPLPLHPEYTQPKGLAPGGVDFYGADHRLVWGLVKAELNAPFLRVALPCEATFLYSESLLAEVPMPTKYEASKFITKTECV